MVGGALAHLPGGCVECWEAAFVLPLGTFYSFLFGGGGITHERSDAKERYSQEGLKHFFHKG